jgi:hypothetical protein
MSPRSPGVIRPGQVVTRMDAAARVLDPIPAGRDRPPGEQEMS